MKNCLRKWFRHLLLISITSVGAAAASPAPAHDLPIFDSIGLYNCFGLSSQTWQLDPNLSSLADQITIATEPSVDWTSSGWSWCFGDSSTLEKVQTQDRQEFSYLGPATSQSSQFSQSAFAQLSDGFSPVKDDYRQFDLDSNIDDSEEFQGCESDEFDCFPAKRFVSQPSVESNSGVQSHPAYYDEGCPDESEDASEAIEDSNDSDEAQTLVNEEFVEIVPDLPEQEIPSFSNMLEAGYNMLPKFSLSDAYSGLRSWLLTDVKPAVLAIQPNHSDSTPADELTAVPNADSNYLRSRRLVDDYLDGESFVRDWRNLQLFRNPTPAEPVGVSAEYGWNAPISDEIAQAEPLTDSALQNTLSGIASAIESFECLWAQEKFSFTHTRALGKNLAGAILTLEKKTAAQISRLSNLLNASHSIAVSDTHDLEMLGQPLFVIHRLDGKEFLLPAKQAKHWNTVPQLPNPKSIDWQAIVVKSAVIGNNLAGHGQLRSNYVEANASRDAVYFGQLSKNLIRSTTFGLDVLADRIHGVANTLRLTLDGNAQVAELGDGESVR